MEKMSKNCRKICKLTGNYSPSPHNHTSLTSHSEDRVINFLGSTSLTLIIAASEYFANINEFIFTMY